jgi:uncharacterized protein YggL (DUF469 family)
LTDDAEILKQLARSEKKEVRKQVVRCIRHDKKKIFLDEFIELINDREPEVRKEAVRTAGENPIDEMIPYLINLVENSDDNTADLAINTLVMMRKDVSEQIRNNIRAEEPQRVLGKKLRLLASMGKSRDFEFIVSFMDKISPETASLVMDRLVQNFSTAGTVLKGSAKQLEKIIYTKKIEIMEDLTSVHSFAGIVGEESETYKMLTLLLKDRVEHQKSIILSALHLLYPDKHISIIRDNIFSYDRRNKNIALEALDNILPAEYRRDIVLLFEKDTLYEEVDFIADIYSIRTRQLSEVIDYFNKTGDEWLMAWSCYTAGLMKIDKWKPRLEEYLNSVNPFVAEHARAGLALMGVAVAGDIPETQVLITEKI